MKVSEFGRLCLTNAHLAFGSKGDARSEPGMTIVENGTIESGMTERLLNRRIVCC